MDRETFAKGIAILRASYPQSNANLGDDNVVEVWYSMLEDLDGDRFTVGVKKIVQTEKFLPAISEIREKVLGNTAGNLEAKALAAWQKVLHAIRRAGYCNSVSFPDDPAIHNAIQIQGGWINLCLLESDQIKFYRPQWLKAYQSFYKTHQEGNLPVLPYLPGQDEINNQVRYPENVPGPIAITDQTMAEHAQALESHYRQRTQQPALKAPGKVTPVKIAQQKLKALVDGLTRRKEVA